MTNLQLVALFFVMLKEHWAYVANAAVKGKVDCSGAFVYALKQFGLAIAHGSNTIWRQYLSEKRKISEIDLIPGMAVFKNRASGKEPEKYRDDGIGDMYHMGCFVGPTEEYPEGAVIHAKGEDSGVVIDSITKGWTHGGKLKQLRYIDSEEAESIQSSAIVVAETGTTVNLRKAPNSQVVLFYVPIGATVTVLSRNGDWANVTYMDGENPVTGWMMTKFLNITGDAPAISDDQQKMIMEFYKKLGALQAEFGELFGMHG